MSFFDGLEGVDLSDFLSNHNYVCGHCGEKILRPIMNCSLTAAQVTSAEHPSWRFYENTEFCSIDCEKAFLREKKMGIRIS